MIDIRKLKELVRLMVENELTELDLKDKDEQVLVRRPGGGLPVVTHAPVAASTGSSPAVASGGGGKPATVERSPDDDAGLVAIESPMVGTFYASPGPDKAPFVSVGAAIGPETVVCLLEAMKIFNDIKAERSGTVVKVLAQSGQAVEFGQKLFLIRPS